MEHYLEIRLLPDPEFTPTVLMNALFAKLHRALVELGSNAIGTSYPEHRDKPPTLGTRLRLHGVAEDLQRLMASNWLSGMRDHISITEIVPVPVGTAYRVVRRVQSKSNPERLRRRLSKRQAIPLEEARQRIPDTVEKRLELPFVQIKSNSNGQAFRLFIEHQPVSSNPTKGEFNCYGLSAVATIPWF